MGRGKRNGPNHGGSRGGGKSKNELAGRSSTSSAPPSTSRSSSQRSSIIPDPADIIDGVDDEDDEENMDFCQRFFGDPLFSNLNVSLLFLTATFLPMIVWIPHFLSEYRRLRRIQHLEEERQMRMQKARLEVKQSSVTAEQQQQQGSGSESEDITILQDSISPQTTKSTIHFPDPDVLNNHVHPSSSSGDGGNNISRIAQATILPSLCPDGVTLGYDNWFLLRDAISEANAIAAEEFLRWNEYLVRAAKNSSAEPPVYRPPEPFVVCPGAVLNQKGYPYRSAFSPLYWTEYFGSFLPYVGGGRRARALQASRANGGGLPSKVLKNKLSPIFINAEDIVIECDMCTVDLPGTHFSFGPHAKNVLVRGITFRSATTSSLTFHHHGADVSLEDCYWLYNSGGVVSNGRDRNGGPYANVNGNEGLMSTPPGSTTTAGAVADLNSTSTVTFFRCVIDDVKQAARKTTTGVWSLGDHIWLGAFDDELFGRKEKTVRN